MEGAPICAVGIVFDTWDGGNSYLCSGYRFRYLGWRDLIFVQWVLFSIPGMEGAPICAVGIVFDTGTLCSWTMRELSGFSSIDGYRFRYLGVLWVCSRGCWVSFSIPAMEGTPICAAGIVFDTYGTVGAPLSVLGIVFDTYVGCGGVFMWVLLLLGVLGIVFDTCEN